MGMASGLNYFEEKFVLLVPKLKFAVVSIFSILSLFCTMEGKEHPTYFFPILNGIEPLKLGK